MSDHDSSGRYLGVAFFVHPLPMAAVAVLILNDHYLKTAYPSWLTGKLSDFAGLFFFPLFLCAIWSLLRQRKDWISPIQLAVSIALAYSIFAAIKLSPEAATVYARAMTTAGFPSRSISDPTDLIALAMALPVWLHGRKYFR